MEETGVKGTFQGILAMREQMDYKYGAADFYIVCVLKPDQNQSVNVQDIQEVSAAQWIPLSEITTNEDGTKYKLFPSSFQYISLIKQWLKMNEPTSKDVAITDLIK